VAADTYWQIRRGSQCTRAYIENNFAGDKGGPRYGDLWLVAESIDLLVHNAWLAGGLTGVNNALATNDALEHMLSRVGAEINYQITHDYEAYLSLLSSKPGGNTDILPTWAVTESRDRSHAMYRQKARQKKGGKKATLSSSSSDDPKPRRRRRKKATDKSGGGAGGGGGKGGGKEGGGASAAPAKKP